MGSRAVSPGGALLRSSRMFSLPKPLPDPQSTTFRVGEHKSPTMTKPLPQYQTIASPRSCRGLGDWGLKRALPLKTTLLTTTPLVRVKQVDSPESLTDFASAADYAISLEKFRELHVPLLSPEWQEYKPQRGSKPQEEIKPVLHSKSVFEEYMDFTHLPPGSHTIAEDDKRWKFEGPWLARMTQGEFDKYLEKKVRPRRAEFRHRLRIRLAKERTEAQNVRARDQGDLAPPPVTPQDITEEQLTEYLRQLRGNRVDLYSLISSFLDMAPLGYPVSRLLEFIWPRNTHLPRGPYARSGPPNSHPSAGISYIRTNSFMENHPVYGPQRKRAHVAARVVYPRVNSVPAKLGVGGFVVDTPAGDNQFNVRRTKNVFSGIANLDVESYGGAKLYVEPVTATVDPSGRVVMKVNSSDAEAEMIAKESKGAVGLIYQDDVVVRSQTAPGS